MASSERSHVHPPPIDRRRPGHNARYDGPERRAAGRGRSGYGMDSIRRYLRAQLEMHSLLRPGSPPPEDEHGTLFAARTGLHRTRT